MFTRFTVQGLGKPLPRAFARSCEMAPSYGVSFGKPENSSSNNTSPSNGHNNSYYHHTSGSNSNNKEQ